MIDLDNASSSSFLDDLMNMSQQQNMQGQGQNQVQSQMPFDAQSYQGYQDPMAMYNCYNQPAMIEQEYYRMQQDYAQRMMVYQEKGVLPNLPKRDAERMLQVSLQYFGLCTYGVVFSINNIIKLTEEPYSGQLRHICASDAKINAKQPLITYIPTEYFNIELYGLRIPYWYCKDCGTLYYPVDFM